MEADPNQTNSSQENRAKVPEIYRFSPEEQRVLRQCNIESFYQRSLPFGTFLGLGAFYLVKSGYLKGHSRFGATPKVCVSVIAGYFLGKLSYQQKCAEKLMALPNSHIGEILRQRKKQGINESLSLEPGFTTPIGIDNTSVEIAPQQSYLDLDSDRPTYSDYDRPIQQESSYDVSEIPVPPGGVLSTSYDELRRRNREENDLQMRNRGMRPSAEPPEDGPMVIRAQPPASSPPKRKNIYGDDWEN